MDSTDTPSHTKSPTTIRPNPPTTTNGGATHSPEEVARLLDSWKISPETHAHILHTRILPTVLYPFLPTKDSPNPDPKRKPLAILLLGQTGAGKTHLAPLLVDAFTQPYPPHPSTSTSAPQQPPSAPQRSTPQPTPHSTTSPKRRSSSSSRRRRRPIHLVADAYKTHHPHFHTCLTTLPHQPHLASRLAGADAARWLEEVCLAVAREGVDVLVETACRRGGGAEGMGRLVAGFVGEGYKVRVVVLGVGRGVSWGGVVGRFWRGVLEEQQQWQQQQQQQQQQQWEGRGGGDRDGKEGGGKNGVQEEKGEEGAGKDGEEGEKDKTDKLGGDGGPMPLRLTPRIVHDESLEGVRGAVGWLDGEGALPSEDGEGRVDRVVVLRRGMKVVYANERALGGRWEKEPAALKALEREWARPLTEEEREMMEKDIEMLRNLGKPEVDRETEEIQRLIAELGTADGTMPDMTPFDPVDFVHKELDY